MDKLIECIKDKAANNFTEVQEHIVSMVCEEDDYLSLSKAKLIDALNLDGDFLVLKLSYENFEDELKNEIIKHKMSQSLSIIVKYEDDKKSYKIIRNFVNYIDENSYEKLDSTFGIKEVDKLSEYPITILFSGMIPITKLEVAS